MTDTNIDAGVSNEALADTTNSEALDTETTEQTDLPDGEQPTETTEPTEEEKAKTEQVKKQKALDARFAELTLKRKEAERRAEAAEARLNAQNAPQGQNPPNLEDWEGSLDDFLKAQSDFYIRQGEERALNTHRQQQAQVHFQETQRRIEVQEQAFAVTHPDYSEVSQRVTSMFGGQFPQHLAEAIADSDNAPALAYELGRDAQGLIDFLEMSPVAQLKRIGAIEANLSTSKPQSKPIPKPPQPVSPVKPNASAGKKDPLKMVDGDAVSYLKNLRKR